MLGSPSASALIPFHGFLANHHTAFAPGFPGSPSQDTPHHKLSCSLLLDLPSNYITRGDNGNSQVSKIIICRVQTYEYNNRYSDNYHGLDVQR